MPVQTDSAKPLAPKNSAKPVAPEARSAAPKPVEPRADNKDSFDLWWEWVPFNSTLTIDFPIHDGGCGAAAARAA